MPTRRGGFLRGGGCCLTSKVFPGPHAEQRGPREGSEGVWTLPQNKGPGSLPAVGSAAVSPLGCGRAGQGRRPGPRSPHLVCGLDPPVQSLLLKFGVQDGAAPTAQQGPREQARATSGCIFLTTGLPCLTGGRGLG